MTDGILTGIRVLDFSHARAGPHGTMMLGDLGADVIKVERPGGEGVRHNGPRFRDESIDFLSVNRNKKSIVCDFKDPADREVLYELVASADVVVQNLRPGSLHRAGFGAEDLLEQHPRLIYCSISGYGSKGQLAQDPSYDQVIQAYSGFMSVTGTPQSGPIRVGLPIADLLTGVFACLGVVSAVSEREKSGRGQHVEVSLLESMVSMLSFQAMRYLMLGEVPKAEGNDHPILSPSGLFKASDGYLSIASSTDDVYYRLCDALDRPDLRTGRFADNAGRVTHRADLNGEIEKTLAPVGIDEWTRRLREHNVPCGPLNDVGRTLDDEQVRANDMVLTLSHPTLGDIPNLGFPVKFSRTPMDVRRHPPLLGEHDAPVRNGVAWDSQREDRAGSAGGIGVGLSHEVEHVVTEAETVGARGTMDLPVLATPQMIYLLEDACAELVAPHLAADEVTVGTRVDVRHLRAAGPGDRVEIGCRIVEAELPRLVFEVWCTGPDGERLGAGRHERRIVNRERLLKRLGNDASRSAKPSATTEEGDRT